MRCPRCGNDNDRVVDSRSVEHDVAVRRRRECLECEYRFTTFERVSGSVLFVVKRSGQHEPFLREKVVEGVHSACKNRPVEQRQIEALATDVEAALRSIGSEVTSEQVGVAVLDHLRELDDVAYLRFASVYKGFEDIQDFAREAGLLSKSTEPKHRDPAQR